MKKVFAKSLLVIVEAGTDRLARTNQEREEQEWESMVDWMIFVVVVALMVHVINPLIVPMLRAVGGGLQKTWRLSAGILTIGFRSATIAELLV